LIIESGLTLIKNTSVNIPQNMFGLGRKKATVIDTENIFPEFPKVVDLNNVHNYPLDHCQDLIRAYFRHVRVMK